MRVGDIIVNPWVSRDFDGKLNPIYATVYIGNNKSVDYKSREHRWSDNLSRPETWRREWRVIGHIDLSLYQPILEAVIADEASGNESNTKAGERR